MSQYDKLILDSYETDFDIFFEEENFEELDHLIIGCASEETKSPYLIPIAEISVPAVQTSEDLFRLGIDPSEVTSINTSVPKFVSPCPSSDEDDSSDDDDDSLRSPKLSTSSTYNNKMIELQIDYQRTLQRLSKSMRRSDETRSIVKRQRIGRDQYKNFFDSPQCDELELSRKRILDVLRKECNKQIKSF